MVRSKLLYIIGVVILLLMGTSCSISYKFNGATIDYTRIKTVTIEDFPNQAPLVYPPLSQMFSERLREQFRRNTRLEPVETNGDLILEGAIVGYELTPMAMQEDALSAMTRFTITVRVSYTNMVEEKKSFSGRTFTSSQEFDSNNLFSDIQEGLAGELIDDLVKQIFNATVEDW